jgi:hypothetical protein
MKFLKYILFFYLLSFSATVLAMRFPEYESKNLNGDRLKIPDHFDKKKNLLIVAFYHEQQSKVNTWLEVCKNLKVEDFACYELPIIEEPIFLMKWIINSGMKSGIKSKEERARVITLYIDKEKFMKELGIHNDQDIYTFLVDQNANILKTFTGAYSNQKIDI